MTQRDRLGRLLFIVPYVAQREGVPLQELAQLLGVRSGQLEADISLLSMVGQPPLTPDHLIDLYIEDDLVYVHLDQNLDRPLRLTHAEAQALVLGARLVGDLGGLGEALMGVVGRIAQHLSAPEQEIISALAQRVSVADTGADEFRPVAILRRAIANRRVIEMEYYSASSDRLKSYTLWPLTLISHSGVEYMVALDQGADGQEKLFRSDRIGGVRELDHCFAEDVEVDLEKFRTPEIYSGSEGIGTTVVLRAEVAREARERFPERDITENSDGSVTVSLLTSSAAWLARWVLPFGLDAEVQGPQEHRTVLGNLCKEAAEAYASPVK